MEVLKRKIAEIVGKSFVTMNQIPTGRSAWRKICVKIPHQHSTELVESAARQNGLTATSHHVDEKKFLFSIGIEGNELPTPMISMHQNRNGAVFVINEKGVKPIHHSKFAGFFKMLRDNTN